MPAVAQATLGASASACMVLTPKTGNVLSPASKVLTQFVEWLGA